MACGRFVVILAATSFIRNKRLIVKTYSAPWGRLLVIMTILATVVCAGITIGFMASGRTIMVLIAPFPMLLVTICALFTIRGYTVAPDAVLIHRLLWTTHLPLAGLQSAHFDPEAMRGSLRLFGNGGLFSFTGLFRNKTLGVYRAFATDLNSTVVLRFPSRTVVVSPSAPEDFVNTISPTGSAI